MVAEVSRADVLRAAGHQDVTGHRLWEKTRLVLTEDDRLPMMGVPFPSSRWADRAACKGSDPDLFFVERGQSTAEAKTVCARCPVAGACLDYAVRHHIGFGVWGGKSARQREEAA